MTRVSQQRNQHQSQGGASSPPNDGQYKHLHYHKILGRDNFMSSVIGKWEGSEVTGQHQQHTFAAQEPRSGVAAGGGGGCFQGFPSTTLPGPGWERPGPYWALKASCH